MKTNNIYIVIDKNFEHYTKDVVKGIFDNNDEAIKLTDQLNLTHYLEIEAKTKGIEVTSRYASFSVTETIDYIVNRVMHDCGDNYPT